MTRKRKKVGEVSTTTVLLLAAAGLGAIFLVMNMNKPTAPAIVTVPGQTSATATQTDIAAAIPVVTTLVSELSGDQEED